MKIKRTFAPDIRQAMRRVREEQGADAVILGNRKVDGGVEILSAIDYDEDMLYESAARQERAAVAASAGYAEPRSAPVQTYAEVAANVPRASEPGPRPSESRAPEPAMRAAPPAPRTPGPAPRENAQGVEVSHEHILVRPHGGAEARRAARSAQPAPGARNDSSVQRARARSSARAPVAQPQTVAPPIAPQPAATPDADAGPAPTAQAPEPAPVREVGREAPGPAAASNREFESLRAEIQALRGLMENQLNVLEWDRLSRRHPTRVAALSRLSEMDIGTELARTLVDAVREHDDPERTWRQVLAELARQVPIADDDFMSTGGVVALVGATGVGKTTTVAKLAARFCMQHDQRNVALVTTDTYRVGAQEQLLHFAQIIGVPLYAANDTEELGRVLARLCDKKLVLIDTAGMSQRDIRLTEQFVQLREVSPLLRSYLVMSANTQLAALDEVVRAFGAADLAGCIITKLDEATSLGPALTVSIRHRLSVAYVGTGQRVPEDISPARAHRLVGRAVPLARRYAEPEDDDALAVRFAGASAHASR